MTLRQTAVERARWLLSRANNPFLAAGVAGLLAAHFGMFWVGGFAAGFYAWHAAALLAKSAAAVCVEDPDDVLLLIEDGSGEDEPALPMTAMGVAFGLPIAVWYTVGIPLVPVPGTAWSLGQMAVAAVGGLAWFLASTFVVMCGVMLVVDAGRRLIGREGLQWFAED